ncbi:MAG: AAA family ATPase [Planctomycetota bacterium]|jgi:chromosome segregation ATPase|nr:AAA family ATPase [Planctomycetota bacterium]
MRLIRLRVANFRGLKEAKIDFAPQGATLVQGPNESGKTSLKDAIGLLFKYKDNSSREEIRDIQPVGEDVGTDVELEATCGDIRFVYRKVFNKGKKTELSILEPESRHFTGSQAHEEAERILDESLDRALFDALSVHQGRGDLQPDVHGCEPLMKALEKAAGGGGYDHRAQSLHELITDEYLKYYTQTGRENRDLAAAAERVDEARLREEELRTALSHLESQVGRLEELKKTLVGLQSQRGDLERERTRRKADLDAVERLERELGDGRLELKAAEGVLRAVKGESEERGRLIEEENRLLREIADVENGLAPVTTGMDAAEKRVKTAMAVLEELRGKREIAEQIHRLRQCDFSHFDESLRLDSMKKRKARIDDAMIQADEARDTLARIKVTRGMVEEIVALERETSKLEGRLDAARPHVHLSRIEGDLSLNGEDVPKERNQLELTVHEDLQIVVPGRVEIRISAGEAPADLIKRHRKIKGKLAAVFAESGVANLEEAFAASDRREKAEATLTGYKQIMDDNLNGLDYPELANRIAHLEAALPAYLENRSDLCEMATGHDEAKALRDETENAFHEADRLFLQAQRGLDRARDERETIRQSHIDSSTRARELHRNLDLARERLASARAAEPDDALGLRLAAAEREAKLVTDKLAGGEADIKALDPENVRWAYENVLASIASLESRRDETEREIVRLESALDARGEHDLFEEYQAERLRLEEAEQENVRLRRKAEAAKLLHDVLSRHSDETRKRYVLPLKREVDRLGKMVFGPSFEATIQYEDLSVSERMLNGKSVQFKQLSGGAREQLALVYRAACSTMAGSESPPVILDDALGYTDENRLLAMGTVLAKIAREAQVVIFTCAPDRYKNIGNVRVVEVG